LRAIADRRHVALIEDCAQAYWAEYEGHKVGTLGDLACFSLQQSKHITSGEGGLMVTSKPEYADRAKLFADKAWPRTTKSLGDSRFLFLSQNYRMSDLQGAVALGQLPKVEAVVVRRRERAAQLNRGLEGMAGVRAPYVPANTLSSYWLYMLHVEEAELGVGTKEFGDALIAEGVPGWVQYMVNPLYTSPLFAAAQTFGHSAYPFKSFGSQEYKQGLCPQAEEALRHVIAVHWNENYTSEHVEQIKSAIEKVVTHCRPKG
jgi:dTDP-4-amino-4,6-dideoxygalactose transaminase